MIVCIKLAMDADDANKDTQVHASPVIEALHFSSPLTSINNFKHQCFCKIPPEDLYPYQQPRMEDHKAIGEMSTKLGVDHETVIDLMDACDVSNLECDYDTRFDYSKNYVYKEYPDDNPLQLVKQLKADKITAEEQFYTATLVESPDEDHSVDNEMIGDNEVIMTCLVYDFERTRKKKLQVLLLGSVKLTELREMIKCRSDNTIFGDFSDNPNAVTSQQAKDLYPSSFFFIEKTFYNDTRNPLNRDYSKLIIEWAKHSDRYDVPGLGMLDSKSMEDYTFVDLEVRLGYPYLFCHQGNCEHIVIFSDLRIRNENDPKLRKSYPFNVLGINMRRKKCSICHIHLPKWVTVNDQLAFEDPALFCNKCFRYLHYTEDGQKLTSFEAYPYAEED